MVLAGDGAEWTWLVAEEKAVEAEGEQMVGEECSLRM